MVVPLNAMIWNCRGVAKKNFGTFLKDLRRSYSFSLLVLLEPKLSRVKADEVVKKFGFNGIFQVD